MEDESVGELCRPEPWISGFNYYFPQDLDDEFLVVWRDFETEQPWKQLGASKFKYGPHAHGGSSKWTSLAHKKEAVPLEGAPYFEKRYGKKDP